MKDGYGKEPLLKRMSVPVKISLLLNFVPFDANDILIPTLTITSYSRLLIRKRMAVKTNDNKQKTAMEKNAC